jgi:hypothetical protein
MKLSPAITAALALQPLDPPPQRYDLALQHGQPQVMAGSGEGEHAGNPFGIGKRFDRLGQPNVLV